MWLPHVATSIVPSSLVLSHRDVVANVATSTTHEFHPLSCCNVSRRLHNVALFCLILYFMLFLLHFDPLFAPLALDLPYIKI